MKKVKIKRFDEDVFIIPKELESNFDKLVTSIHDTFYNDIEDIVNYTAELYRTYNKYMASNLETYDFYMLPEDFLTLTLK